MCSSTAFCLIALVLAAPLVAGACEDGQCQSRSEEDASLLQGSVARPHKPRELEEEADTEDEDVEEEKEKPHASLAHSEALKKSIIEKTKKFAEAMKSLKMTNKHFMKADFEEVLEMFKDDVANELEEPSEKKVGSLLYAATSAGAKKRAIRTMTGRFAKAIKNLFSTSKLAMQSDFDLAFAEYKDDIEHVMDKSKSAHFAEVADETSASHFKEAVVEMTEDLSKAMHDLVASSTGHLKQDYKEVMEAYMEDVRRNMPGLFDEEDGSKDKDTSLIASEEEGDMASMKKEVVTMTQHYADALEDLETDSDEDLSRDLDGVMKAYSDDIKQALEGRKHEEDEDEDEDEDE